ncbi:double-strand break repair protein AddB [Caulobacter vibrioides]|uniref:double-strand break repair protein AddB n=1 Tax=Caulobacter vibrioides TaxID=155892 RepID=UPI000BB49743|nr:double-strand break repair protein AddB [Caulobacter vibrioides]ATC26396.1 double-strand break repair protein AddB [Caulobacter vibrioides]AZH14526.1 double-strand break repair protein AddB [Caulobacter vibrioides]PLR12218.1 double-strand break repair protein AddB [Caulobacter vibrioides]
MSGSAPFFDREGPRWYSIPAHRPFVDDLARGLLNTLEPLGPEALPRATVLTPTRRGARALADAFLSVGGGRALLLPQIRPLGDLDEGEPPFEPGELSLTLPPAISSRRRRFELARLVTDHGDKLSFKPGPVQALELAKALSEFLDSCQIEEVNFDDKLDGLAEGDLAQHWQVSARFLRSVLRAWSTRLDTLGLIDVSERRVRLLRALEAQWRDNPPTEVLVAAGSTGTAPATADLLRVIAAAPKGAVVLPGLDEDLADTAWAKIEGSQGEQHPQGAMKRLLDRAGVSRAEVRAWVPEVDSRGRWRRRIVNEALRPAEATADWLSQIAALRAEAPGLDPVAEGLTGFSVIAARAEEEAAGACALLLREALEDPVRTAALVTPDQTLARRVMTRLQRWGVIPDSSAGAPLAAAGSAILALHLARLVEEPLNPVRLLAFAKHPLVLGEDEAPAAALLERKGLRGAAPGSADGLRARLRDAPDALTLADRILAAVNHAAAPYGGGKLAAPARAAQALVEALESLIAPDRLWAGNAGECLGTLMAALIQDGEPLPDASPQAFADILDRLVNEETVRVGGASHPRLRILGAIEARLVRADRLVLAGLEEGVWPQGAPIDPFLSRPMRQRLGLPPPERRIGLTAHDFAQAASAPHVVLVHCERRGGAPAVESRWLWRLKTLAAGAGLELPRRDDVTDWVRALDAPGPYAPIARPAPTPPVEDRPRRMAVTRVEALTRDPYAVWARDILKLYPLERPDEPVEARARGTAIHAAFERFAELYPDAVPAEAALAFEKLYVDALVSAGMPPTALAREKALAREAALWVADWERQRRTHVRRIVVEAEGKLDLVINGRPFTLTAKADRIEPTPDGTAHILDYKTGAAPSQKQVDTGFSPQLTLTAAILMNGGFPDLGKPVPGDLTYVRVTGRRPAGEEQVRAKGDGESEDAARKALEGLSSLIARYDDPDEPYRSRVAPQFVKEHPGDYAHLARVFEWSTSGDDGEGE